MRLRCDRRVRVTILVCGTSVLINTITSVRCPWLDGSPNRFNGLGSRNPEALKVKDDGERGNR